MSTHPSFVAQTSFDWATQRNVQNYFAAAMNDLFCLAFLVTAHADRAEECVIRSIRECMKSTRILREGLPAWVRNSIIRNGIAIANQFKKDSQEDKECIAVIPPSSRAPAGLADYSAGVLELSSFDRLVYVICVLEHYTSRHCALLLRTSREEVREARIRALAHIAEFESRWRERPANVAPAANGDRSGHEYDLDSACGGLLN